MTPRDRRALDECWARLETQGYVRGRNLGHPAETVTVRDGELAALDPAARRAELQRRRLHDRSDKAKEPTA